MDNIEEDGALRGHRGSSNVGKSTSSINSSVRNVQSCTTCRHDARRYRHRDRDRDGTDQVHRHRGMRRRAKTEAGLETFAVLRSLDALDGPTSPCSSSTPRWARPVRTNAWRTNLGRRLPSLVVLNKWELIATEDRDRVLATVARSWLFSATHRS